MPCYTVCLVLCTYVGYFINAVYIVFIIIIVYCSKTFRGTKFNIVKMHINLVNSNDIIESGQYLKRYKSNWLKPGKSKISSEKVTNRKVCKLSFEVELYVDHFTSYRKHFCKNRFQHEHRSIPIYSQNL